MVEQRGVLDKL